VRPWTGPAEFISILVQAGINPDEFNRFVTPLIAALQLDPKVRKPEVTRSYVKALIENKADVNLRDKKEMMTPLQWARKTRRPGGHRHAGESRGKGVVLTRRRLVLRRGFSRRRFGAGAGFDNAPDGACCFFSPFSSAAITHDCWRRRRRRDRRRSGVRRTHPPSAPEVLL
jgi:hypothetical protein